MSTPEIITVNSESLEAQIRELLPSQNGFGSELQASNVIMPIIDLTSAAEGSALGNDLQTALAYSNQTAFGSQNQTVTIATGAGFYRITATVAITNNSSTTDVGNFFITDGSTPKFITGLAMVASSTVMSTSESFDFVVFLRAGDSVTAVSSSANTIMQGSTRQLASVTGSLINPTGFVVE